MIDEKVIGQFKLVTGELDESIIDSYLSMANGHLEQAIAFYMDYSSTKEGKEINSISPSNSSSLATLREEKQNSKVHNALEDVRAPMLPKREILLDRRPDSGMLLVNKKESGVVDPFRDIKAETLGYENAKIGSSHLKESGALGGNLINNNSESKLVDLFRPPFDIMFHGGWDEAKCRAAEEKKYLLINLQRMQEFPCQAINRDLWRYERVKTFVKEHFIFLQLTDTSEEGARYERYYPVENVPHIAVIDSQTGERLHYWEYLISPEEFIQEARDRLDDFKFEQTSRPSSLLTKKRKTLFEMTEEEQLAAAIEASKQETQSTCSDYLFHDTIDDDQDLIEGDEPISDMEEEEEEEKISNTVSNTHPFPSSTTVASSTSTFPLPSLAAMRTKYLLRDEPGFQEPQTTRLQFRFADGQRFVRRFYLNDFVGCLFEYLRSTFPHLKHAPINLRLHTTLLNTRMDETLEQAGLSNASIYVTTD